MAPTAAEVARRLAALKVVCLYALQAPPRAKLAELARGWKPSEKHAFESQANADRDAYWQKVKDAGLWRELAPSERTFALSTVATMTARQQLDAAWHTESVAVLLWALGRRLAMAGYDAPVENEVVHESADPGASLRSPELLEEARAVAELWHWRGRMRELADRGTPLVLTAQMRSAGIQTYEDLVRHAATGAHDKGHIPAPVEGDFPVHGKPYRTLSAGTVTSLRTLATERLWALNWLVGRAPSNRWDDTPVTS